jgi:hypothetical protein
LGHKPDIKQFRQACREASVERDQRHQASDDFHAAKRRGELPRQHMRYGELVAWLREWGRS